MTPDEFVRQLHSSIVEGNANTYRDLFTRTDVKDVTDPYWLRATGLYSSLDNVQSAVFVEVMRQVTVDTISSVLAVLDGVSRLEGQAEDLTLIFDHSPVRLNGDLTDRFLEIEEEFERGRERNSASNP